MFVTKDVVPVTCDGQNIIYIYGKMSLGVRNRVRDALLKVEFETGKQAGKHEASLASGAYETALLVHNIVRWDGPAFAGVACVPANIEQLDPDEPLVARVLEEIAERNRERDSDPKSSGSVGEPSSTANGSQPVATIST